MKANVTNLWLMPRSSYKIRGNLHSFDSDCSGYTMLWSDLAAGGGLALTVDLSEEFQDTHFICSTTEVLST